MDRSIYQYIPSFGFEGVLDELIAYAETQAKLHQSSGDRSQWEFWVRFWANLQRAADAIALGGNQQDYLEMWRECHGGGESSLDFDFSDN